MLVIVCVSDEVEEAIASWVDPLVHVTIRSGRSEEHERETLAPSTTDIVPLGLSVGGLNSTKKSIGCTYY